MKEKKAVEEEGPVVSGGRHEVCETVRKCVLLPTRCPLIRDDTGRREVTLKLSKMLGEMEDDDNNVIDCVCCT